MIKIKCKKRQKKVETNNRTKINNERKGKEKPKPFKSLNEKIKMIYRIIVFGLAWFDLSIYL